jgi:hypothetical protein
MKILLDESGSYTEVLVPQESPPDRSRRAQPTLAFERAAFPQCYATQETKTLGLKS